MTLEQNLAALRARMDAAALAAGRTPGEVQLCAATKVQSDDTIRAAIAAGLTLCGENRVQELSAHLRTGAYAGACVHFIGHLQTNKVKQVVGQVELIHSVDSEHLLRAVSAQAEKLGIVQDILVQVNIGREESKGGCLPEQTRELCALACALPGVALRGLMAIPPAARDPEDNRPHFAAMRELFVDIKEKMSDNRNEITCLSMGMSGDFACAIAEGATLIRVGTALFGPRPPVGAPR